MKSKFILTAFFCVCGIMPMAAQWQRTPTPNDTLQSVKVLSDGRIALNMITTDSNDYASPVFLENPEYKAIYVSYAGHSVTFPKMEAFDLLDKNVTVTLKVYDDEGTVIYEGTDAYTLHIGKAGEYTADYTVYDSNGNQIGRAHV